MNEASVLVRAQTDHMTVAMLCGDKLVEYHHLEENAESYVGSVFLGRVERVLPGMKAAFVKLGLKQNGFLPLTEQEGFHQHMGKAPLVTGQDVLVQVKKDPKGEKGAFLTRDIALAGQYALVMPNNRHVGVSQRITDEGERSAAKRLGIRLGKGRFGVIIRHAALFAREADVFSEAEALYENYQQLATAAACRRAPELLLKPEHPLASLLKDYSARYQLSVYSDLAVLPAFEAGCDHHILPPDEMDMLFRQNRVEEQLEKALCRKVELSGGGNLMIDQREALHTIDVNTASNVAAEDERSLPLMQNLLAVEEIARQIRLRNLSGIILVDFIDMDTETERDEVLRTMEEAVRDDRVKTVIHGFTRLGILEMTRKRTRETLLEAFSLPCTHCGETGRVQRNKGKENERG